MPLRSDTWQQRDGDARRTALLESGDWKGEWLAFLTDAGIPKEHTSWPREHTT